MTTHYKRRIVGRIQMIVGLTIAGMIMSLFGIFGLAPSSSRMIEPVTTSFASDVNILIVPTDYATIQAAVNAASSGDIIQVRAGTYNENVVVTKSGLRLYANRAGSVIDGNGLTGDGITVLGTALVPVTDVEITGFEVRDFRRGIVLQYTTQVRIRGNEVHDNNKFTGSLGLEQAVGIDVVTAHFNEVTGNTVYNNGARGIGIRVGSTNNVLRANRINDNGLLTYTNTGGTGDMWGTGITVTGLGTNDNKILENEIMRNWGRGVVLTRPPGTPITGNLVAQNRVHQNQRAGIAIMGAAQNNYILQNNATDNNLSGLPPCLTFNLFDDLPYNNIWTGNQGTSNFTVFDEWPVTIVERPLVNSNF